MPHPVGKKCLCILGMHRSGTSCLTGIAQQYGVELGEVFTENPHNRRGNREHAGIQALNNDVLTCNGGNWDRPVEVCHWNGELMDRRDRIIEEISQRAETWWGFKDPRVMLTLPFWQEGIGPMEYIGTFRHPIRVAQSIAKRDRKSVEEGIALWLTYNRLMLQLRQQHNFPVVDFDMAETDYLKDVQQKLERLGLTSEAPPDFFDSSLRHQTEINEDNGIMTEEVSMVFQELKSAVA